MSTLGPPATIATGVYALQNRASISFLDMSGGSSTNGNKVQGWHGLPVNNDWSYDQRWLIQPLDDAQGGGYTVWNLRSGTYLELSNGSNDNGAQAQGWARVTDSNDPNHQNQEWVFHTDIEGQPHYYNIINKRSGTALDLSYGAPDDGTKVQGWAVQPQNPNQSWRLLGIIGPGLGGIVNN